MEAVSICGKKVFSVRCKDLDEADMIRRAAEKMEVSINKFFLLAAESLILQQEEQEEQEE